MVSSNRYDSISLTSDFIMAIWSFIALGVDRSFNVGVELLSVEISSWEN